MIIYLIMLLYFLYSAVAGAPAWSVQYQKDTYVILAFMTIILMELKRNKKNES